MWLVGSERNGTYCRVPRYSESCGISLSSRRNSQGWSSEIVDERTFFSPANRRVSASRRRFSALSYPRPIFHRWNLAPRRTWRAWKVKIASASHYCIVGVARHPVKVKQFAGPYIDARCHVPFFSLFPFLPSIFFCSPIRWFLLPSLRRILVDTRVARVSPTLKLSTR